MHGRNRWKIATNSQIIPIDPDADLVTPVLGMQLVWEGQREEGREEREEHSSSRVGEHQSCLRSVVRGPSHDCCLLESYKVDDLWLNWPIRKYDHAGHFWVLRIWKYPKEGKCREPAGTAAIAGRETRLLSTPHPGDCVRPATLSFLSSSDVRRASGRAPVIPGREGGHADSRRRLSAEGAWTQQVQGSHACGKLETGVCQCALSIYVT